MVAQERINLDGTMLRFQAICAIFIFVLPLGSAFSQESFYLVNAERLACLSEHADLYLQSGEEQYLIDISRCPDETVAGLFGALSSELPHIRRATEQDLDTLLLLTRPQLNCLGQLSVDDENVDTYRYFRESCMIEAVGK